MAQDKVTSVRLPQELVDKIDDLAAQLNVPRGRVIEDACQAYVSRGDDLPRADWTIMEESGSSGFSYALTLHFSYPAMGYADGAVYIIKEDLISRLAAAGAREIWTELTGIRSLEWEVSALAGYHSWRTGEPNPHEEICLDPPLSTDVDNNDGDEVSECRHGRPECQCRGEQPPLGPKAKSVGTAVVKVVPDTEGFKEALVEAFRSAALEEEFLALFRGPSGDGTNVYNIYGVDPEAVAGEIARSAQAKATYGMTPEEWSAANPPEFEEDRNVAAEMGLDRLPERWTWNGLVWIGRQCDRCFRLGPETACSDDYKNLSPCPNKHDPNDLSEAGLCCPWVNEPWSARRRPEGS